MIGKNERTLKNLSENFRDMIYLRIMTEEGFEELLEDIEKEGYSKDGDLVSPSESMEPWRPMLLVLWNSRKHIAHFSGVNAYKGYISACNVHRINYDKYKAGEEDYYIVKPSHENPLEEETMSPQEALSKRVDNGNYLITDEYEG